MTIKKNKVFILITALLLVGAVIFFVSRRHTKQDDDRIFLQAVPFKMSQGWGYDIMAGDRKYIHQIQIPGIAGRPPFASQEEALKTGRLVVYKITHDIMPAVSAAELDSLGVSYKK